MKFATVKTANEIIRDSKEKELTNYFGQTFSSLIPKYLSLVAMKELFLTKGFGEDETNLILASLVKAGCKFTVEEV